MSIHNQAKKGDIAKTVLLPGDPLRAKFIAENFLKDAVCYNEVRGMLGYTGYYDGQKVSVQGTGMGMPSMSIYATELIEEYGCEQLIRIGSCGSIQPEVQLRDVILAQGACTDNGMNQLRFSGLQFAPLADFDLLHRAYTIARGKDVNLHIGNVLSSDFFYNDEHIGDPFTVWQKFNVLAVEMETAALYTIAAKYKKRALSILTVSDHIPEGKSTTSEERQTTFTQMMDIALKLA